jgi:hypothetical protein
MWIVGTEQAGWHGVAAPCGHQTVLELATIAEAVTCYHVHTYPCIAQVLRTTPTPQAPVVFKETQRSFASAAQSLLSSLVKNTATL